MSNQEFPDLTYKATKIYEGINRQDYAELSVLYVAEIRDELRAFKPQLPNADDQARYDRQLSSTMQALDLLEEYFKDFQSGQRTMLKSTAQKTHSILLGEIKLLESLSKG